MTPSAKPITPPAALYVAVLGLLVLAAGLGVASATGTLDRAAGGRYFGMLIGVLMIIAGNALPKLLRPGPAGDALRTAERLAGWIFVLGGLTTIGLWLWAPEANRLVTVSVAGLAIFALVLVTTFFLTALQVKRGTVAVPDLAPEMRQAAVNRRVLFHILHAIMWVFAIFLMAELRGAGTVSLMAVGFTVSMGVLDVCLAAPLRRAKGPAED